MKHFGQYMALLLCTSLVACGAKTQEQRVEALTVETETVGLTSEQLSKTYVGEVEAESSTSASFTGMGTVMRVLVKEGQHVTKGQTLAVMDPTQNENALRTAESTLNQAQDAYNRMKKLHDSHSLSDMDWVNIDSKLQQARAMVDMAKKSLTDCTLKAPCSGIIGKKTMESGQTALPAEPVCEILTINKVKVKVSIPEKEIAKVTPALAQGNGVQITVAALDGRTFRSHSFTKGVEGDAMTHTYDVSFDLDNPDGQLLPGMVAEVSLPSLGTSGSECITVPVRAVQQGADGKEFVWINQGGKAHRANVCLGATYGNRIEVASGLKQGDKVLIAGYQKVSEGSLVK